MHALLETSSGSQVGLVVGKSHACSLLGGVGYIRTGFESCWGRISVAVPVAYMAMLSL